MTGLNGVSGPIFQNTSSDNASKPNVAKEYQQYILSMEQNFNTMLNDLVSGSDSKSSSDSDTLSSLIKSTTESADTSTGSSTLLDQQRLSILEQNSQLLGQEVIFYNSTTGQQETGTVNKILVSSTAVPSVVLTDGRELPVASLVGLKQK
ncbi:MAG: hypothetical protein WCW67_05150 [Candidatus Margulisiibacteriota bacterium]|jgi:hypothetical protein